MTDAAVRASFLWKTNPVAEYCRVANAFGNVECQSKERRGQGGAQLCRMHANCFNNYYLPTGQCKFIGCMTINNRFMHVRQKGLCKKHYDYFETVQPIFATIPFPTPPSINASALDIYRYNKASNHGKITMPYIRALINDHLTQNDKRAHYQWASRYWYARQFSISTW